MMANRRVVGSRRVRVEVWSDGTMQCEADLDLIKIAAPVEQLPGVSEFHGTLRAPRELLIDLAGTGTLTFRAGGRECEGFLTDSTGGRVAFSSDVPFDV
jgi:hypothetical protein